MWSLILKTDIQEYDCIPNSWLIDDSTCFYPDKSTQTLKKMARDGVPPPVDEIWEKINITLIKRDFENFERCMTDMIRISRGRPTLTESEKENRGKCLREKKRRRLSSESETHVDFNENFGISSINSSDSDEETGKVCEDLALKIKKRSMKKGGKETLRPRKSISTKLIESRNQLKELNSPPTSSLKPANKRKCPVKNANHFCVQKDGGKIDMNSLADGFCALSRSMVMMKAYFTEQFENLKSQISTIKAQEFRSGASVLTPVDTMPSISTEENDNLVLAWFPVQNLEKFEELEHLLKDSDFKEKIVCALTTLGAGSSSSSRALTWMLRNCLSAELTALFSWSGQKKLSVKKKPFNETNFQKVLFSAVRRRFHLQDEKIERSVKSWLQQTAYDLQHGAKRLSTEETEEF